MSDPSIVFEDNIVDLRSERGKDRAVKSFGGGGGGTSDMERRVEALEEGMKELRTTLKDLREGQHRAEVANAKQDGDLRASLAEFGGKIGTLTEASTGLRRDLDKLPSKYDVTVIMIAVLGGLSVTALLIKNIWPLLSKLAGP